MPDAYAQDGRKLQSGEYIRSRTGDLYAFQSVVCGPTATAFGKIRAARVLSFHAGRVASNSNTFTDFAFGITIR